MSSSGETPPQSTQRRSLRSTVRRSFLGFVIGGSVVIAVMLGALVYGEVNGNPPSALVLQALTAALGLAYMIWARPERLEDESIDESRRRLTRAEGDLERALRNDVVATHGVVIHGTVQGDLVLGPRQAEGDVDADDGGSRDGSAVQGVGTQHLALAELWAATHARLELYHKIATSQAKQSFLNAQVAMVVGFVLLVAFVVVALQASTTAGSVIAGGLGAVSAALAGFVSKTFVRSQEASASHLRSYFDQPLELSRFLAAERLIADSKLSDEQRAEVLMVLVQAMVAGPPQPGEAGPEVPAAAGR
ncbi:hypothetical protein OG912_16905 [Streptomyces sp. NBC_00464]|uniref:hypothetical protein n=1 Tax=Streptomyces sp. NBC_00464 TaxID=2975751 RepID=UPI002E197CBB